MYPDTRLRRLRKSKNLRRLVRETAVSVNNLVMPYFVSEGKGIRNAIASMPGINQLSIDNLLKDLGQINALKIPAIILFGIPKTKDANGSAAFAQDGIIQKAVKKIKKEYPDLVVITDACLCEYTSHGHCGILSSNFIDNDKTLKILAKVALSHAQAGGDIIAPSAMMDGQVKVIRDILDKNGFIDTPIMSYSAKFASSFYSPFREAAKSQPQFGDRKYYQMDYANVNEALREVEQDLKEGADIVMVKPALAYLDVIAEVKEKFNVPLAAYNVSGEYSMIKAAADAGWINEKEAVLEIITGIKRAGADIIISYHAKDLARWL